MLSVKAKMVQSASAAGQIDYANKLCKSTPHPQAFSRNGRGEDARGSEFARVIAE